MFIPPPPVEAGGFATRPLRAARQNGRALYTGTPAGQNARLLFIHQGSIRLRSRPRGFHLVTDEIVEALPELRRLQAGLLHLLLQHTSGSLFLNENADPDVRADFERWTAQAVPEGARYLVHTAEGPDDMPAHIKSAVFGTALTLPVRDGRVALGTWQGIYLGEHRDRGGSRTVLATLMGEGAGR